VRNEIARPDDQARMTAPDFKAIADYGLLSDCNGSALVARDGSIDWLCLPRFDSPALFARLLDPEAGHWTIAPAGDWSSTRAYLDGSLVVETTFTTPTGSLRLTDGLAFADGQRGHGLGNDAPHELLRLVEALDGSVELQFELAPRPEYGLVKPLIRLTGYGARSFGGPNQMAVSAPVALALDGASLRARFTVEQGQSYGFALRWTEVERAATAPTPANEVNGRLLDAVAGWRSWEAEHDLYQGRQRQLVKLSARVLKGLSYQPTGAIVAAPTCSLPEAVGGQRNWDYRYAWIRDASLTLEALYIGACPDEAVDFVSFMTSAAGGGASAMHSLQIMYGIGGEHDLSERTLGHLRGWRESAPVRVGNGAWGQTQLDVYGEFLITLALYERQLGALHPEIQRFIAELADTAARRWPEADQGMWEMRGPARHHLSSKVMCWAALDCATRLAPKLGDHGARADRWAAERDRIRDAVFERGWSESKQAFAQSFDSDQLDAAQLLMPLVGFLPASDPKMRATIEAIAQELTEDGLVLRYLNDQGLNADGLEGEEGTFVICSFWLASCLAQAGQVERAEAIFERLVGYSNDLGLLAEEIDARSGELLGNFPQAFSHIGLIKAAHDIDMARAARETQAALA
jgi:alpha,alpha-trehalase